jgi:hypothetical protein
MISASVNPNAALNASLICNICPCSLIMSRQLIFAFANSDANRSGRSGDVSGFFKIGRKKLKVSRTCSPRVWDWHVNYSK